MSPPARTTLADQHFREDEAERVDVGALIDGPARRLFRRHVGKRADDRAGRSRKRAGLSRSRDAEVGQYRLLSIINENVRRLQIPVHDANLVRRAQARYDLAREPERACNWELPFLREQLGEVRAVDERHRDVLDAVDLAEIVNADDIDVRDLPRQHELALEATLELLGRHRIGIGLDDFERERQRQLRVPDVVHRTHAADAKETDDLITQAEGLPRYEVGHAAAGRQRVGECGRCQRLSVRRRT